MLMRRAKAPEVYLQRENTEGCKTLVKYLKDALIDYELSKKSNPKKKDNKAKLLKDVKGEKKKEEGSSSFAYQVSRSILQFPT